MQATRASNEHDCHAKREHTYTMMRNSLRGSSGRFNVCLGCAVCLARETFSSGHPAIPKRAQTRNGWRASLLTKWLDVEIETADSHSTICRHVGKTQGKPESIAFQGKPSYVFLPRSQKSKCRHGLGDHHHEWHRDGRTEWKDVLGREWGLRSALWERDSE